LIPSAKQGKADKNKGLKPSNLSEVCILKVLVAYYSDTGNTEKIAKAIYEEASKKHQAQLKKIKEVKPEDLGNYDFVFLGSPCHSGDLAAPAKKLLAAIPKSPRYKLAAFLTHMSEVSKDHGGYNACIRSLEDFKKDKQVDLKGVYDCQGVPSQQVAELIKKVRNLPAEEFENRMKEARKHPSAEDIQKAKEFVAKVLSKT
jgi:flavodoxin I